MSQSIVVLKFGGTSLATPRRLRLAARRIRAHLRRGEAPVVVASALGHTTDRILQRLERCGISPAFAAREVDRALATGEILSSAMLAGCLCNFGIGAMSLSGGEAGFEGSGEFGRGTIAKLDASPVRRLLAAGLVPVIAGFQAKRPDGETVTLGRGASDTTAVALAAALGRVPCHIVTDVGAVYDRDPNLDAAAQPYRELSHDELLRLAEAGARVVHPAAARWALDHQVPLCIYSYRAVFGEEYGTRVGSGMEALQRSGEL
jgi:aspartate kinase